MTTAPNSAAINQAQSIISTYNAAVSAVRGDATLSEVGKAQKISALYTDAKTKLDAFRDAGVTTAQRQYDTAAKALLSMPASPDPSIVLSWRDAQDRAARVENANDAAELLTRAVSGGDTVLAQAVFALAFERQTSFGNTGWGKVIQQYADAYPAKTPTIQSLIDARNNLASMNGSLIYGANFYISTPPEVATAQRWGAGMPATPTQMQHR